MYHSRNVTVLNPNKNPPDVIAGFYQNGSVSISSFHRWLSLVPAQGHEPWSIFCSDDKGGPQEFSPLDPNDNKLLNQASPMLMNLGTLEGRPIEVVLTDEVHLRRIQSTDSLSLPPIRSFRDRVRDRDERCCVTNFLVRTESFARVRATHIFPLAYKDVWDSLGFAELIDDDYPATDQSPRGINSIQNGILLRMDVHHAFDGYEIGIDPDNNYRVIDFMPGGYLDGKTLWVNETVEKKYRPLDDLLRYHLKQCVLANVKGLGRKVGDWSDPQEPFDLSKVDTWGEQVDGNPSRLQLELQSRLFE